MKNLAIKVASCVRQIHLFVHVAIRIANEICHCYKQIKSSSVGLIVRHQLKRVVFQRNPSLHYCYWAMQNVAVVINFEALKLNRIWTVSCWSRGNAFVSGAGGLRFKSRAGQIGQSAANGSPTLQHFFERSCAARAQWRRDGPRKLVRRFGVIQRVYWKIGFENQTTRNFQSGGAG